MIDPNNLPPPSGKKPGRFVYAENSVAPVWIEYYWWQRVPWFKVMGLLIAFLVLLKV